MKKQIRFVSIILSIITTLTLLCSCAPRPLAQGKLAGTVVGTVKGGSEEYDIYYEEFYQIATVDYENAKANGGDKKVIAEEAWTAIKKDILKNSALIELCKSEGLNYDEKALRDRVNDYIETNINSNFDGDSSEFKKAMEENGMTDHFLRYLIGVEMLYSDLGIEYQKNGTIPNTDEKIEKYIKENFVRTQHIAIYVDENDDRDTEYARAEEALQLLKDGTSMDKLIGSDLNEDIPPVSPTALYGNYFHRGVCSWGEDYEKAVLDTKTGRYYNKIIETKATHPNTGKTVECFYVVERLSIPNSEIEEHFNTLSDLVKNSILSQKVANVESTLKFEPNEYAKGLDLTNLEKPENGIDYQLIIIICVSVGAAVLLIVGIFLFRTVRAKRFQKALKKNKALNTGNKSTSKNSTNSKNKKKK